MKFINDIFARLGKAMYFTVIDCTSGYWQVPLNPKSRQYTAFTCKRGLFEFLVMPIGITDAKTFQRGMDKVLEGLIGKICDVYQDDIITYSETLENHVNHDKSAIE